MSITVLSRDDGHRAIVTELDDCCLVEYYARNRSGRRSVTEAVPQFPWRFLRQAYVMQPFHCALNVAHDIVNTL